MYDFILILLMKYQMNYKGGVIMNEITKDQKIKELLFMLTNIEKYIKYYDPKAFEVTADKPYISYDRVVQFVLDNSIIIKNKYMRETFEHFFYDGVDPDDPLFVYNKMNYSMVKTDVDVTLQEIAFIYILKNWEINKNVIVTQDIPDNEFTDQISDLRKNDRFPCIMWMLEPSWVYDSLLFFQEQGDSHLISVGVIRTPDLDEKNKALLFFFFASNNKDSDPRKNPFMVLRCWIDVEEDVDILTTIEKSFSVSHQKRKYDDFTKRYKTLAQITAKLTVDYSNNKEIVEDNTEVSYKPARITNIRNRYSEIYQGNLKL